MHVRDWDWRAGVAAGGLVVEGGDCIVEAGPQTIIASNLPLDVTETEMKESFEAFGRIKRIQLHTERQRNIKSTANSQLVNAKDAKEAAQARVAGNKFSSA